MLDLFFDQLQIAQEVITFLFSLVFPQIPRALSHQEKIELVQQVMSQMDQATQAQLLHAHLTNAFDPIKDNPELLEDLLEQIAQIAPQFLN